MTDAAKDVGWTIFSGDGHSWEIEPALQRDWCSNAAINGVFATKLEALDSIIADKEDERRRISESIARAKRMRRRELERKSHDRDR